MLYLVFWVLNIFWKFLKEKMMSNSQNIEVDKLLQDITNTRTH